MFPTPPTIGPLSSLTRDESLVHEVSAQAVLALEGRYPAPSGSTRRPGATPSPAELHRNPSPRRRRKRRLLSCQRRRGPRYYSHPSSTSGVRRGRPYDPRRTSWDAAPDSPCSCSYSRPWSGRRRPPEQLLPATTQVYLRWDGVDAHRASYEKTGLGQMMNGDTGRFVADLYGQIQDGLSALLTVDQLLGGVAPDKLAKMQADATEASKLPAVLSKNGFILAAEVRRRRWAGMAGDAHPAGRRPQSGRRFSPPSASSPTLPSSP